MKVTPRIVLDDSELEERFIHASGPGGQHVNKVATAVELRFDAARSPALPEPVRARLLARAGHRHPRPALSQPGTQPQRCPRAAGRADPRRSGAAQATAGHPPDTRSEGEAAGRQAAAR